MAKYGYNFPWSGRIGRFGKCLSCGDAGDLFKLSSFSTCLRPECRIARRDGKYDPQLEAEADANMELKARKWCSNHGIDYDATVANYMKRLGPPIQERDDPIPGAEKDYTVYAPNPEAR